MCIPKGFCWPTLIAVLLIGALASSASAQDWFGPDGYEARLEAGFLSTNFENSETGDDSTLGGVTLAVGLRCAQHVWFEPRASGGRFTGNEDTSWLSIQPLDFSFEFGGAWNRSGNVGLDLFLRLAAGVGFYFFTDEGLLRGERDVTFTYLPLDMSVGLRLYIGQLFFFVSLDGGYHVAIDSTADSLDPDNLWRAGGTVGLGVTF